MPVALLVNDIFCMFVSKLVPEQVVAEEKLCNGFWSLCVFFWSNIWPHSTNEKLKCPFDCAPRYAYFTKLPFLYLLKDNRKCHDSETITCDGTSMNIELKKMKNNRTTKFFNLSTISMVEWNTKFWPGWSHFYGIIFRNCCSNFIWML